MRLLAVLLLTALLAACGSAPLRHGPAPIPGASGDRDGAEAHPPANLAATPDAAPHVEAIRKGGPNKPYEVDGETYTPQTGDAPLVERGLASWYGKKFHGHPTASGEVYDMYAMTAAHATMPIPSYARVRNPANGREVIVRINDRGPFHKGRVIDLSYTAALKLGILNGVTQVEVERITYADIANGAWQRPGEKLPDAPPVYAAATPVGAPPAETTAQVAGRQAGRDMAAPPDAASDAPARPVAGAAAASTTALAAAASQPVVPAPPPESTAAAAPLPSAPKAASPGYWVQLGAFGRLDGAEQLRRRVVDSLDAMAPLLAIFRDGGLNRLQAGPYATREDARAAQRRVHDALGMDAVIVLRK
ncbi:MAG: septal ring lytic transglycosylase RlpA family protein [Pelomonas sp.]|nr:septal ring lytic transglycosylase RlpA family protein [Roseateles sp.]